MAALANDTVARRDVCLGADATGGRHQFHSTADGAGPADLDRRVKTERSWLGFETPDGRMPSETRADGAAQREITRGFETGDAGRFDQAITSRDVIGAGPMAA